MKITHFPSTLGRNCRHNKEPVVNSEVRKSLGKMWHLKLSNLFALSSMQFASVCRCTETGEQESFHPSI